MANRRGVCVNAQRDNKMEGAIHVKEMRARVSFLPGEIESSYVILPDFA